MKQSETANTKIGIFSFFAGAGFLDLGFEQTKGFETLFVNEVWRCKYYDKYINKYL